MTRNRDTFHPNDLPRREVKGVTTAQMPGRCPACGEPIAEGDNIQRVYDSLKRRNEWCHAGECAEEWGG